MSNRLSCDAGDCPYDGEPSDRRGWHLDKSFNLGYILTAAVMAGGFTVWAMAQERRLVTVEVGLQNEHEINLSQDSARFRAEDLADVWRQRVETKIDRLTETLSASSALSRREEQAQRRFAVTKPTSERETHK